MTAENEKIVKRLLKLFSRKFIEKHGCNPYLNIPNIKLIIHRFERNYLWFLKTEEDRKKMEVLLSNQSIRQLFLTCSPYAPDLVFRYLTAVEVRHTDSKDNELCNYCFT